VGPHFPLFSSGWRLFLKLPKYTQSALSAFPTTMANPEIASTDGSEKTPIGQESSVGEKSPSSHVELSDVERFDTPNEAVNEKRLLRKVLQSQRVCELLYLVFLCWLVSKF
jgi:hypothetical protein